MSEVKTGFTLRRVRKKKVDGESSYKTKVPRCALGGVTSEDRNEDENQDPEENERRCRVKGALYDGTRFYFEYSYSDSDSELSNNTNEETSETATAIEKEQEYTCPRYSDEADDTSSYAFEELDSTEARLQIENSPSTKKRKSIEDLKDAERVKDEERVKREVKSYYDRFAARRGAMWWVPDSPLSKSGRPATHHTLRKRRKKEYLERIVDMIPPRLKQGKQPSK